MKTSSYSIHKPISNVKRLLNDKTLKVHKISVLNKSKEEKKLELYQKEISSSQKFRRSIRCSERRTKNLTCVNLGVEDDEVLLPIQSQSENPNQLVQAIKSPTQRIKITPMIRKNSTKQKKYTKQLQKPQPYGQTKFNFLFPNQSKKALLKFEKKLLSILYRKKLQNINTDHDFPLNQSINTISYTQKLKDNSLTGYNFLNLSTLYDSKRLHHKNLLYNNFYQNNNNTNKENINLENQQQKNYQKVYRTKYQAFDTSNNTRFQQANKTLINRPKLSKKHFKHNLSGQLSFIKQQIGRSSQYIKQNFSTSTLYDKKYLQSMHLNEKIKFKKIQLFEEEEKQNCNESIKQLFQQQNGYEKGYYEENRTFLKNKYKSQQKLKNILKLHKSVFKKQKEGVFTPWQAIPSQKQIYCQDQYV